MDRTCPKCKSKLSASDCHFCLNCGEKLDDSMVLPKGSLPVSSTKEQLKIKVPLYTIVASLALIVVVAWIANFSFKLAHKPNITAPAVDKNNVSSFIVDVGLDVPEGILGDSDLLSYVPSDVDFFFEGYSVSNVVEYFKNVDSDLIDKLNGHFVGFVRLEERGLGFAFEPTEDTDINKEFWYSKKDGKYLLVTNKKEYLQEMTDAGKKIIKSIEHNSKYASSRVLLPKKGKLMFISLGSNFGNIYQIANDYSPTDSFWSILDQISRHKFDKFVLE